MLHNFNSLCLPKLLGLRTHSILAIIYISPGAHSGGNQCKLGRGISTFWSELLQNKSKPVVNYVADWGDNKDLKKLHGKMMNASQNSRSLWGHYCNRMTYWPTDQRNCIELNSFNQFNSSDSGLNPLWLNDIPWIHCMTCLILSPFQM